MHAEGQNGYVVVSLIEEPSGPNIESLVLLPEDYQKEKSAYVFGTVQEGDGILVFPRSVLEEIDFGGETFHLVSERYVICKLRGEF